jgi:hypothetical protein
MKAILYFAIPLLVLFSVVAVVAGLESRRRPDWQAALDQYLVARSLPSESSSERASVLHVANAHTPWNFIPQMGVPFRDADWRWSVDTLPFPPSALYCVLVQHKGVTVPGAGAAPARQVVYVGHHTDALWRSGWLVHTGPHEPFPPELVAQLTRIGCNLVLE